MCSCALAYVVLVCGICESLRFMIVLFVIVNINYLLLLLLYFFFVFQGAGEQLEAVDGVDRGKRRDCGVGKCSIMELRCCF